MLNCYWKVTWNHFCLAVINMKAFPRPQTLSTAQSGFNGFEFESFPLSQERRLIITLFGWRLCYFWRKRRAKHSTVIFDREACLRHNEFAAESWWISFDSQNMSIRFHTQFPLERFFMILSLYAQTIERLTTWLSTKKLAGRKTSHTLVSNVKG